MGLGKAISVNKAVKIHFQIICFAFLSHVTLAFSDFTSVSFNKEIMDFNVVLQKGKQEKLRLKMYSYIKHKYVQVHIQVHYIVDTLKCPGC